MPSEAPTTNGARCRTFVNREVHSGFQHHAQSFAAGVTSDDACRDRCTVAPGCTIWVRQPSTNMCWLSTQTGSITLRRSADRNAGLRCEGTATVPEAGACRCSGRTSRSGGDCSRGWCYTDLGACADGRQSRVLGDQEWSFLACAAKPTSPTPNPTLSPTPAPTSTKSECENIRWTVYGRCGRRFGGQVCDGRDDGKGAVYRYCSNWGWCGDSSAHNKGNVAYDFPEGCKA